MLNLASLLTRSAFVFPGRTAVICQDYRLSYRELDGLCSQAANGLRSLGIGPGDAVGLACGNRAEFIVAYYAILRLGAVVVPLNVMFKRAEFSHPIADADLKALICQQGDAACPTAVHARQAWQDAGKPPERFILIPQEPADGPAAAWPSGPPTLAALSAGQPRTAENYPGAESDTAVILYTSGTTGAPKGAELSHSNLALNAAYSCLMQKADSRDVHLVALPLFHAFGQTLQMNAAVTAGAALVLMPRFDAMAAWSAMAEHGVTLFAGVPTMYLALLDAYRQLAGSGRAFAPAWRLGMSGGAALPVPVIRAFEETLGLTLLEGYGLSETSPLATFSFMDTPRQAGCVGFPLYGTEVRIEASAQTDGPGEIQVRGHHVMQGYRQRLDATREAIQDGWFTTGDLGCFDASGALRIVDRAKDVIVRGGYKVYPREIEELLMTHPAVAQAAVVGIPDERLGEEVAAAVVLREAGPSDQDMIAWLRERFASYKYPRHVQFMPALPRNALGKVLKQVLRDEMARGRIPRESGAAGAGGRATGR